MAINSEPLPTYLEPSPPTAYLGDPGPKSGLPYKYYEYGPPRPACYEGLRATHKALDLMDAPPDPEVENILKLVTGIFDAPAALVAFFDDNRIFIKEAAGMFKRGDFPWRQSFCGWTTGSQQDQIMVIPDATKDPRFANSFVVSSKEGPGVKFYCGTPLMASNGHRLGTLCFADTKPREFDAGQCQILDNFAEMVVRLVEKDILLQQKSLDNEELREAYSSLKRGVDSMNQCVILLDTTAPGFEIMYTNEAWNNMTGLPREKVVGLHLADVFSSQDGVEFPSKQHQSLVAECKSFDADNVTVCYKEALSSKSEKEVYVLRFRPASMDAFDNLGVPVGIPSYIPRKGTTATNTTQYYFATVEIRSAKTKSSTSSVLSQLSLSTISSTIQEAVDGLEIYHMLGKGAYGVVYSGNWFGTSVAVKIIDHNKEDNVLNKEALLGSNLRHPHIVATLHSAQLHRRTPLSQPIHPPSSVREPSAPGSSHPTSSDLSTYVNSSMGLSLETSSKASSAMQTSKESGSKSSMVAFSSGELPKVHAVRELADPFILEIGADCDTHLASDEAESDSALGREFSLGPASSLEQPCMNSVTDSFACYSTRDLMGIDSKMVDSWSGSAPKSATDIQTVIVLEFCSHGCLQDAVDRGWLKMDAWSRDVNPNMAGVMATAKEIASALQYLHSKGVVHGDLSSFNILLASTGTNAHAGGRGWVAKIADFGLSRSIDIMSKIQTRSYGTLTHMPPETLMKGTVSFAVDVYSFGVLMWQMYYASRPWAGMTHGQIIMAVASKKQLVYQADCPKAYAELSLACMAWAPEDRPTIGEIMDALVKIEETLF